MKISPKYLVIRHTQEKTGNFFDHVPVLATICFRKLLITVLPFSNQKQKNHTIETIAKKVTLFNSLKSSFSGNSILSYKIGTWAYHSPGATRKKSFN